MGKELTKQHNRAQVAREDEGELRVSRQKVPEQMMRARDVGSTLRVEAKQPCKVPELNLAGPAKT